MTWNRWVIIQFCCFHLPTIFSSLGSLILGEQIVHIDEFEDKLAFLITNRIFNLPESPFFSTIQFFRFTFLLWFSFQHENHHHCLQNHIFIVFAGPPPPPPHYYCFPTTTTFLLFSLFLHHHHCRHQISSVFPPSSPHFYCIFIVFLTPPPPPPPPHSNAYFHHYHYIPIIILVLMFSAFTYSILAGKAFGFVSKNCMRQNTTHSSYPT